MSRRETPWDPDWFQDGTDQPEGDRRSDIVRDILEALSDEDQFIAFAKIYEKLSYRDLGDRLGLSHEGARQRWIDIERHVKREYQRRTRIVTVEHPEYGITVEVDTTDVELYGSYIEDGWRVTWN